MRCKSNQLNKLSFDVNGRRYRYDVCSTRLEMPRLLEIIAMTIDPKSTRFKKWPCENQFKINSAGKFEIYGVNFFKSLADDL